MINKVKKIIPVYIKKIMYEALNQEEVSLPSGKRVFIFLAADYGNIGDIAITKAQMNFIETELNELSIVKVPISKTKLRMNSILKKINKDDLITIVGGGNMGVAYFEIEALRQLVITKFHNNKVVCFPQTLDVDKSKKTKRALDKIQKVYSKHPDISIFARESLSKKALDDLFEGQDNVKIGLTPDIVLSSNEKNLGLDFFGTSRAGALLCMRNDSEKSIGSQEKFFIEKVLEKRGVSVKYTDTHIGGHGLTQKQCDEALKNKLKEFSNAQLVVTDRLHGMILAYVSRTPCIAFPNSNHKIIKTWEDWLSEDPYVVALKHLDPAGIEESIACLLSLPSKVLGNDDLKRLDYSSLRDALIGAR
jgi:pyruvyl transferase EpsI